MDSLLNFQIFSYNVCILLIVIITIGILGNIISIIVFSRKTFAKNSISTYCRALAFFECFTAYQLVICIFFINNVYISALSNISCKLSNFANIGISSIPGWILVAFSLDKLICVTQTQKYRFLKKKSYQLGIVAFLAIFNCLLYIEIPILINIQSITLAPNITSMQCDASTIPSASLLFAIYVIEANFIPFLIMILSTIFTVRSIVRSRLNLEQTSNHSASLVRRRIRDTKFAVNSIVLNVIFILFKTPAALSFIITIEDFLTHQYFLRASLIPFYLNFSISFFVHLATNSIFRSELKLMLKNVFVLTQ
jgi:hypothetical protein